MCLLRTAYRRSQDLGSRDHRPFHNQCAQLDEIVQLRTKRLLIYIRPTAIGIADARRRLSWRQINVDTGGAQDLAVGNTVLGANALQAVRDGGHTACREHCREKR